jgi:hypothetical protein
MALLSTFVGWLVACFCLAEIEIDELVLVALGCHVLGDVFAVEGLGVAWVVWLVLDHIELARPSRIQILDHVIWIVKTDNAIVLIHILAVFIQVGSLCSLKRSRLSFVHLKA